MPISIIPEPQKLTKTKTIFTISQETTIRADKAIAATGNFLKDKLNDEFELKLEINHSNQEPKNNVIFLKQAPLPLDDEGYQLEVSDSTITITAGTETGIFYGIQTLLQILPGPAPEIQVSGVVIEDEPRFKWRGLHLDVCRHLFSVAEIKKLLETMAFYKLNTFHWHLTEDQGWRIEIKKYPKLTSVGSIRKETIIGHYNDEPRTFEKTPYGGFFTQEEAKEIVDFATKLHITVVPEIDIPGHCCAAIASYPELSSCPDPIEVKTIWGVHDDGVLNVKEDTFQFLFDVFSEIIDLFPGKYIHIGGDEAPKTMWKQDQSAQEVIKREGLKDEEELQSYFIRRIEEFINSKGRSIIGWDEILEGGLAPNAAVMSWRGEEGGITAANQGHDVVMTPSSHLYFDHYQGEDQEKEPLAIGGFTSLKKTYSYEPIPETIDDNQKKHVLGAQGNIWTEYIPDYNRLEYMAFPRALALAEIAWSPAEKRDWESFKQRVLDHFPKLAAKQINYRQDID